MALLSMFISTCNCFLTAKVSLRLYNRYQFSKKKTDDISCFLNSSEQVFGGKWIKGETVS